MANRKISLMSEEYLNDVSESIFSNLTRAVRKREPIFIWGPININTSTYAQNNVRNEIEETWHSSTLNDSCFTEDLRNKKLEDQNCLPLSINRNVDDMLRIRTENQNSENPSKVIRTKRTMSENEELENSRKNPAFGTKRNGGLLDKFSEWCNKRHTEFEGNKFKTSSSDSINDTSSFKVEQKKQNLIPETKECLNVKQKTNNCDGLISRNNNELTQTVERQTKSNNDKMKVLKEKKNTPNNIVKENNEKAFPDKDFAKSANKKKENLEANKDLNLLSIKLINESEEKSYEYIKKLSDILRIKRQYPKLLQVIPNIDSESNEITYSIEAVNIILRYLLNQDYKLDATSSPICGIEVLAATRSWGINNLHEKCKDFLHKVVTPSNVSILFSYANKYGLEEICNVCENIAPSNVSLKPRTCRRDKKCFITVATYVSPLECSFPFTPLSGCLQMSFERHIKNTVQFEAVSGCFKIVGFQLQLNEDHLSKNKTVREGMHKLTICYTAKNNSSSQAILDQSVEKCLRPINIVYFKKGLIINCHEMCEIVVEVDIKPYLCSSSEEIRMKFNSEKFKVSVLSSFPLRNSVNQKLFFIKKIFYDIIK